MTRLLSMSAYSEALAWVARLRMMHSFSTRIPIVSIIDNAKVLHCIDWSYIVLPVRFS